MNIKVPSFDIVVKKLLAYYRNDISNYASAEAFRSAFRSSLENTAKVCHILFEKLDHPVGEFKELQEKHESATKGKRLLCFSNREPSEEHPSLALVSKETGEERVFDFADKEDFNNVKRHIFSICSCIEEENLKKDVEEGKVKLPVSIKDFKAGYKKEEVQRILHSNYEHLDNMFLLLDSFPDNLYKRYILKYWDFEDLDKLPTFKRYLYKYFSYLNDCDFSRIMKRAKYQEAYRECLLGYAEEKNTKIFGRLSYASPNLSLVKRYWKIWSETRGIEKSNDFVWNMMDACTCNDLEETRKVFEYLCEKFSIPATGEGVLEWARNNKHYHGCGDFGNVCTALFRLGYLKWTTEDYHNHKSNCENSGDRAVVNKYESWMIETGQTLVPLPVEMTTIKAKYKVYDFDGQEIHCLSSSDEKWSDLATDLWNHLLNDEDKPAKRNEGNQFPMCEIYEDRIKIESYIGLSFFTGEESIGKMTFGDMCEDGQKIKESFIWGSCDCETFLSILNDSLKELGYHVEVA